MHSVTPASRKRAGLGAYTETVARGIHVSPVGGLRGQHDNVRMYWENQITRTALRPFVREIERAAGAQGRKVRILDLGCGAGHGYELLTRISQSGLNLDDAMRFALPPERVELYLGLDVSDAMVEQGRQNFPGQPAIRFEQADLREGLSALSSERGFDLYFSSYGALSHLDRRELKGCLTDVVRQALPGAAVVLDLVGRLSPEWPVYWNPASEADKTRPYSISYLYDDTARPKGSVESFALRFWTGDEIVELCQELASETGIPVEVAKVLDRSIFVGRHVDTREYGCTLPPLRRLVNRLYEQNARTRLEELCVDYHPDPPGQDLKRFFGTLAMSWNALVDFTRERIRGERIDLVTLDGWPDFRPALQLALMTMDRIVDSFSWIDIGDIRANLVEPQLAYVLQRLEHSLQSGQGCGHGLVAVLRVGAEGSSPASPR